MAVFTALYPNFIKIRLSLSCHQHRVDISLINVFLPRDAMHKRGLCRHAASVCVSVTFDRELCQNE